MHLGDVAPVSSPDLVGTVLVPVAAVLVSAAIALVVAGAERRAATRAQIRAQTAELIRALSDLGAAAMFDADSYSEASRQYARELNAFAALLGRREVVVAKFVCEVIDRCDPDAKDGEVMWRAALWASTALELWGRNELRLRDFRDNMPRPSVSWVEKIDLGEWNAVLRGAPAIGVADITGEITT